MTREDKRINTKKIAERRVRRDHADKILEFVATNKIKPVLLNMNTTLRGLSEEEVLESRSSYGKNKVTHEKKKTLFQRLVGAFVNPFTAILFFLAVVSAITDIIMPIMQRTPEDHYLYHGVHFRNAAVCTGIPFRECSGKIIGDDYHDLYGRQKRKNENGNTIRGNGSWRYCPFICRRYGSCRSEDFRGKGFVYQSGFSDRGERSC